MFRSENYPYRCSFIFLPIISIRISDEERRKLQKDGKVSQVIREAIRFYIDSKRTRRTIKKLSVAGKVQDQDRY
jgi:hypothetical protein